MAEWIRQLYKIEHRAHDVSIEARRELRAAEAVPVLDKIETYLDELAPRALPKSALAKAVTYARNQWTALRRYTEDGRLTIDNNISERTLRHQAIGRKNWCAPEVPSRTSGRMIEARDALLAMFERTVAVWSAICI